jgi:hypothetical protein
MDWPRPSVLGNASGTQTAMASAGGHDDHLHPDRRSRKSTALLLMRATPRPRQVRARRLVVRLVDDNGNGVGRKAITWVVATAGSVNPQT